MGFQSFIKSGLGFVFLLFGMAVSASAQSTTHTVTKGETLFSIARQYDVKVQQLKQWNNLQSNQLSPGQTLSIKKSVPENAVVHTVEPKETLFSISKQYNVNIAELKSWNNLSGSNVEAGQELTIYPSQSANQQKKSVTVDKKAQQNTYYVVKSGDSLYKIAQQHGMTIDALKTLNDLSSNTIRVGQQLAVRTNSAPPSIAESAESSSQGKFIAYKVSGEDLQELLEKFQMEEPEFRALNPDINLSNLRSGQQVTILAPPTKKYENPYLSGSNLQGLGTTSVSKYSTGAKSTPTTNGELYNPQALTAAHSNISLGSVIYIENTENQKGVYVRINDRISGGGLKISAEAWNVLNFSSTNPTATIYQNR